MSNKYTYTQEKVDNHYQTIMCSVEINKIGLFQGAKWCTSKDGQPHDMSKSDKKLLNNVTEEPNLQTKQSDIQVLDFCLNVWGRYSKE